MRTSLLDSARRAYLGAVRSVLRRADDSKKMQLVDVQHLHDERHPATERFQNYSHTSVPLPPDQDGKGAEALTIFLNGNRSHPVVIGIDDRRHRVKNLKPGESAHHDDQKQVMHVARDGYYATAKQHVVTAGDKPATTYELNEQLKGLGARMAQAEHNLHGLFDVTSRFRQIVQQEIPAVASVEKILNQKPEGLKVMADAILGKEQDYLQHQVQQALEKFLSPNLAGLASLLGGNLEGLIGNLEAHIGDLLAQNPIIGQVDDLVDELAGLTASGAAESVIADMTGKLQGQINALTEANPIIGTVAKLRATMQGFLDQAGPGLNFLAPQKRLVQGLSKSMRISK